MATHPELTTEGADAERSTRQSSSSGRFMTSSTGGYVYEARAHFVSHCVCNSGLLLSASVCISSLEGAATITQHSSTLPNITQRMEVRTGRRGRNGRKERNVEFVEFQAQTVFTERNRSMVQESSWLVDGKKGQSDERGEKVTEEHNDDVREIKEKTIWDKQHRCDLTQSLPLMVLLCSSSTLSNSPNKTGGMLQIPFVY